MTVTLLTLAELRVIVKLFFEELREWTLSGWIWSTANAMTIWVEAAVRIVSMVPVFHSVDIDLMVTRGGPMSMMM